MPYYAVAKGRNTGVYSDWNSCKSNVNGYSGASFKKFDTLAEAKSFASSSSSSSSSRSSSSYSTSGSSSYSSSGSSYSSSGTSSRAYGGVTKSSRVSKPSNTSTGSSKRQQIYVDGASRGNGRAGIPKLGYGVYYGPGDTRNAAVPLSSVDNVLIIKPTNQRAELHALRHSLRDVWTEVEKNPGSEKQYEILTDSSYGKNAIDNWSTKWSKNEWKNTKGVEIANRDLIEESVDLYKQINTKLNVLLTHVRGHQGIAGNEAADRLANEGADQMGWWVFL